MRYAAIDIGSNAVRLLIADIIKNGEVYSFKKNTLVRVPLRLGDDAFIQKNISRQKAEDLLKTMQAFKNLMDVYRVESYRACATSAMRDAVNAPEILKSAQNFGLDIEVITGSIEAEIIFSTQISQQLDIKKNYLFIDVGGGSTELTLFSEKKMIASQSFDLGTIRILDNQDHEETWEDMKNWVHEHTKGLKNLYGIGTGGNINKLSRLANAKEDKPLSYLKMKSLYDYLTSFSLKDRINILGLNADRADVIIPACEIFMTIMRQGKIRHIQVPRVGLADGMIQTLIQKNLEEV